MPVVIKRDETGKDPKARKATSSSPSPKASTKAASAGAKPNAKGAKDEPNELPKVIGAIAVIVLAVGFFVWYMFASGGSSTSTDITKQTSVDRTPTSAASGTGTASKGGGGISTDESAPSTRKGGLGRKTEGGAENGGEGIE
jgi:hypothetical protein